MQISFKSAKLAKTLNDEALMKRKYGSANAKQLRLRLAVLHAAPTLADVPTVPPDRCHQLHADWKGCFAVDLQHPHRLVFEPDHDPIPRTADGGIDRLRVTAITILDVLDYH